MLLGDAGVLTPGLDPFGELHGAFIASIELTVKLLGVYNVSHMTDPNKTLRAMLELSEALRALYVQLRAVGMHDQATRFLDLGIDLSVQIADHIRAHQEVN